MNADILLYKELIDFCNKNRAIIETKFKRTLEFSDFNKVCYEEIFLKNRYALNPPTVKQLKETIPGLTEAYKKNCSFFMNKRNESIKGLDIQKGQWYEKALQMFLETKGYKAYKKGSPFPDYEVTANGKTIAYYELKYIESPFITANTKIKDTYPYASCRFDYEASLTLDTGKKLERQRNKIESDLLPTGMPVHYIWWFDCFHIKGIFAMAAKDVFDYHDHLSGDLLVRKQRGGDLIAHQELGKIYPPLLNMITFSELLNNYGTQILYNK